MSTINPIIPKDAVVKQDIVSLIKNLCPISRVEMVDEVEDVDEEIQSRIYKYVGIATQKEVFYYINRNIIPVAEMSELSDEEVTGKFAEHYRTEEVLLLEATKGRDNNPENVVIFWHENVVVVMISNTEDQHEGVMNHYSDAALLLTQMHDTHLLCEIFTKVRGEDPDDTDGTQ